MALGTNLYSSYQRTRSYLRKTKDKMISPFGWNQGQKGKPINSTKVISNANKERIKSKLLKQSRMKNWLITLIYLGTIMVFGYLLSLYFR